jgi:hypothetical protein
VPEEIDFAARLAKAEDAWDGYHPILTLETLQKVKAQLIRPDPEPYHIGKSLLGNLEDIIPQKPGKLIYNSSPATFPIRTSTESKIVIKKR